MARRASADATRYSPLDATVLSAVMQHVPSTVTTTEPAVPLRREEPTLRTVDLRPEPLRLVKKLDQEKRILFTREETHAIDRLVNGLAQRLQAQVKASHVFRALTLLVLQAEGDIDRRATSHGPMIRPPNGDMAALQRFERDLARLLAEGLRHAGPLN